MKKYLLLISIFISVITLAQENHFEFDGNDYENYNNYFIFDTISNPNNIWQIGQPQKAIFDSSYSSPNALITDTINTYPTNDTSIFYIEQVHHEYWAPYLDFMYKIDADSLNDYGTIEVSPDKGQTWIDVIKERDNYDFEVSINLNIISDTLLFTGSNNNWRQFSLFMAYWDNYFNYTDTVMYRFTFISDSIETNRDGWIIDNILIGDYLENINSINNFKFNIYPNPSTGKLSIESDKTIEQVEITDINGRIVKQRTINKVQCTIDLSKQTKGIYFVKLIGERGVSTQKIILE